MEINSKIKDVFSKPKTKFGLGLNLFFIGSSAIIAFGSYCLITFDLCVNDNCTNLKFTRIFVTLSSLYVLFGVACLVVAHFLFKNKLLPSIYSNCIVVIAVFNTYFIGLAPFIISNELSSIT